MAWTLQFQINNNSVTHTTPETWSLKIDRKRKVWSWNETYLIEWALCCASKRVSNETKRRNLEGHRLLLIIWNVKKWNSRNKFYTFIYVNISLILFVLSLTVRLSLKRVLFDLICFEQEETTNFTVIDISARARVLQNGSLTENSNLRSKGTYDKTM